MVDRNPGPIYDSSMRDIFELILHRIRDEIQRGEFPGSMNVSASVKTNVKTTNGMIRPDTFRVIAGPCTVESHEQFVASAKAVRRAGFDYVRGGAFKPAPPLTPSGPRRGGAQDTLRSLGGRPEGGYRGYGPARHRDWSWSTREILQIGARNMANFSLPTGRCGDSRTDHGVVLKRGTLGDGRGVAARCRVHHGGGRGQRSLVRTRDPHFRDEHAFHADLSAVIVAKGLRICP